METVRTVLLGLLALTNHLGIWLARLDLESFEIGLVLLIIGATAGARVANTVARAKIRRLEERLAAQKPQTETRIIGHAAYSAPASV